MARLGITYQDVADVASQLAARGDTPTIDTVRVALGNTGSKSTIGPLLKRWRVAQNEQAAQVDTGLPAELLHGVQVVYAALRQEAFATLTQAQAEHEAGRQAWEGLLATLQAERDALQDRVNTLEQRLASRDQRIEALEEEQREQNTTLATQQQVTAALQQRLADQAVLAGELVRQLEATRGQFEHFQQHAARQREQERSAAEQRLAEQTQAAQFAQQQFLAASTLAGELRGQLQHLSGQNQALMNRLQETEQARDALRSERDQLAAVLGERTETLATAHRVQTRLQTELQAASAAHAQQGQALGVLQERLDATQVQLAELKRRGRAQEDERGAS